MLGINESHGTSLDIAIAFSRFSGALFTAEKVDEALEGLHDTMDSIIATLRLAPIACTAASQFLDKFSSRVLVMTFELVIFGYLIPLAIIIFVTVATCWYIREEIRNLYQMLVPFPVAKKACEDFLAQMDRKVIKEMMEKQREDLEKGGGGGTSSTSSASFAPEPPV